MYLEWSHGCDVLSHTVGCRGGSLFICWVSHCFWQMSVFFIRLVSEQLLASVPLKSDLSCLHSLMKHCVIQYNLLSLTDQSHQPKVPPHASASWKRHVSFSLNHKARADTSLLERRSKSFGILYKLRGEVENHWI